MRSIFLVSQSDANRHLIEKLAQAALSDEVRICARDAKYDCCGAIPCKRMNEFERAGYRVVIQVNCDLFAPGPFSQPDGLFLVLTEEPTLGAFKRYEVELARRGRQHSVELLQYCLANHAISQVNLWRKCASDASPGVLVMRVEDFVSSPQESLRKVFSAAGVEVDDRELDAMISAEIPALADVKALESSPHFARPYFVEYMNLLAREAAYLGYATWQDLKAPSGPVTTIYLAQRALDGKNYEEAASLLTPLVGTSAVEKEVRAMLGRALLEVGRELEGRRALEVVLRGDPDYLDGYTLLAEHAYETGLNVEARGYLREAAARPGGTRHVTVFLDRLKFDPELALELFEAPPATLPLERQSVLDGFRWILGRRPESEEVIDDHRHLANEEALRQALLRSQEFVEFFERFEAAPPPFAGESGEPVTREDVILALRWILGRTLRSRAEADELLESQSRGDLRLRLFGAEEFKQAYGHAA